MSKECVELTQLYPRYKATLPGRHPTKQWITKAIKLTMAPNPEYLNYVWEYILKFASSSQNVSLRLFSEKFPSFLPGIKVFGEVHQSQELLS